MPSQSKAPSLHRVSDHDRRWWLSPVHRAVPTRAKVLATDQPTRKVGLER